MKCQYCGEDNEESAVYCEYCGSKLEKKKSKVLIVMLVSLVIVIISGTLAYVIFSTKIANNEKQVVEKSSSQSREKKEVNNDYQYENDTSLNQDIDVLNDETLDINVQEEVAIIRKQYNKTEKNIDSYLLKEQSGIKKYYDDFNLIKLVIKSGTNNWKYERQYYFNSGKLYFAFIYIGKEEYRYYFKDNCIIRYIDNNDNVYDYGNIPESTWDSQILNEANKYKRG